MRGASGINERDEPGYYSLPGAPLEDDRVSNISSYKKRKLSIAVSNSKHETQ